MDITIKGTPKEIADTVLEIQRQQTVKTDVSDFDKHTYAFIKEQAEKHRNVYHQFNFLD